jgi:ATP-binding cassette, subfamily B, bacterial
MPTARLRHLLALISPPRLVLALCLLLLMLGSLLNLLNPWIAGQLTALLTTGTSSFFPDFGLLAAAWAGILLSRSALSFITTYKTGAVAEDVLAGLRSRLYEHLQLLPLSYYDDQKRGNILSILTNDAATISNFVTGTLVQLLPTLLTFLGAAFMVFWISPWLGLITLAFLPVYFFAMKVIGRRLRPLSREWVDTYGSMVAHADENLSLLPVIKSFTREAQEAEKFLSKNNKLLGLSKRQLLIYTTLPTLTALLASLGLLILVSLGYGEISAGNMTSAQLVSLVLFAVMMNQPLAQLANVYGDLQRTLGASERILDFLSEEREPDDSTGHEIAIHEGKIDFDHVSFAYPGNEKRVLDNLILHIKPCETVAIVGENGAGKTTLAHLLMRLIDPHQGSIRIDGQDLKNANLRSLRGQIGLVAQYTLLLNGTVAENIGWGKAFATTEEIEQAATSARAHGFITQLPQGYNTVIGDQGLKLSGGQRQRLSLARALLKNPPILILDEATSMFDPAAEADFLRDCRELFANRTVILITHRPASLAVADRVLRLGEGQLTEVRDVDHYLKTGDIAVPTTQQG